MRHADYSASGYLNIGNFKLSRPQKGQQAIMTIEVDGDVERDVIRRLRELPNVTNVVYLRAYDEGGAGC